MFHIITTRELQKYLGKISSNIEKTGYIVTNHGLGKMIILPYFDGCDEFIDEYLEDYEIFSKKEELDEDLKESYESGQSDLII